jgi:hypothetical protein
MEFAARDGVHFWSTGGAWGTCAVSSDGEAKSVELRVLGGQLRLTSVALNGVGAAKVAGSGLLGAGKRVKVKVS